MNPNKESLPTLTVIRYPAAVWVVLLHLHNTLSRYLREPYLEQHPILMNFIDRGFLGVTFFFVLSGFILGYTYDRPYARKDFYIARAARVLPVYYLSLFVSIPGTIYLAIKYGHLSTLIDGVPVLFLVQSWIPPIALYLNGPAWTLSCEAFFYALFPWLNARLSKFAPESRFPVAKFLAVIAGASLLGSCLPILAGLSGAFSVTGVDWYVRMILQYPGYEEGGKFFTLKMWIEHLPLLRICEFIVGVATYRLFRASVEKRTWTLREARGVLVIATVCFVGFLICTSQLPFVMLLGSLTAPACAFLIFAVATHDKCRQTEQHGGRLMTFGVLLGQSSYAVYLFHVPVLAYMLKIFEKTHLVTPHRTVPLFWLMGAALTVVVTAISILIFQFYEEPARQLVKAKLSRQLQRRSKTAVALDLAVPGSETLES